ncbi:AAA family ATPase [Vallitalea guaymasensis]|uniref:AAA family ATPase n=1 Tax=Vallitalea guaymasensis TaxID=1185412 RepID=UPI00187D2341|nr:ATP-binding protein [Vallitalea guaymasensis]
MIRSFIFENFKSFANATLDIEQLTIMVGANAGGKTNAIEGIKILSELVTGREISDILDGTKNFKGWIRGGSEACPRFNTNYFSLGCVIGYDDNTDLEYKIRIKVNEKIHVTKEELKRVEYNKGNNKEKTIFITKNIKDYVGTIKVEYNNNKRGPNPIIDCMGGTCVLSQLATKIPMNGEYEKRIISEINHVIKRLRNILFFDPEPANMEIYSRINDVEMKPDGSNLPSVLHYLCKELKKKNKILEIIKALPENEFEDISFDKTPIGDVMFKVREKVNKNKYDIESEKLSYGTLRALSIVAALLQGEEKSMIIIEEVNNGIHPSRASKLIDIISNVSHERNIDTLITTHNTALLNAVDKKNLKGVVVCYRNTVGSSKFVSLIDLQKYPSLMAKGRLGELLEKDEVNKAITNNKNTRKKHYTWMED